MLLLAHVDGVSLEEHVNLAYRTENGYILVLSGPDGVEERQLRAGNVALAFTAATHQQLSAVKIMQSDASTSTEDLELATTRARAELLRLRDSANLLDLRSDPIGCWSLAS